MYKLSKVDQSKIVVRLDGTKTMTSCFLTFNDEDDLEEFIGLHSNISLHEIIPSGNEARKLFIDLDAYVTKVKSQYLIDLNKEIWTQIVDNLIKLISSFLPLSVAHRFDSIYCDNSKYSTHLIFDGYYFSSNKDLLAFMTALVLLHNNNNKVLKLVDFVDLQVYKETTSLRLPYCVKRNCDNIKLPITKDTTLVDGMIRLQHIPRTWKRVVPHSFVMPKRIIQQGMSLF